MNLIEKLEKIKEKYEQINEQLSDSTFASDREKMINLGKERSELEEIVNVYEQYKYRHVNPDFTAWVQYFIINPLDEDPNYWIKHKKGWDNAQNFILNKNK